MNLTKKALLYLFFSVMVVMLAQYIKIFLIYLDIFYTYLSLQLTPIFSTTSTGIMIRTIVILSLLPVAVSGPPALAYRLVKKQDMPYFMELTWFLWLILVLSKMLF